MASSGRNKRGRREGREGDKCINLPTCPPANFTYTRLKPLPVFIILVDRLSTVTTADDMVKRPSKFNSRPPCHLFTVYFFEEKNKNILDFPD
jgi:hypothetical protein